MKHIKRDFSFKAWVRVRWVDLGGGAEAIFFFQNMVMLHIKLKLTTLAAKWLQMPTVKPSRPRGWGQKVKLYLFLKTAMLHNKLKGTERRAP